MGHEKEYMDVLSAEGKPTGESVLREEIYQRGLPHYIVHVMVLTPKGDFILQRRSQTKSYMPGRLVSAGSGHVKTGETLAQAGKRELAEEAGSALAEEYYPDVPAGPTPKIQILRYEDPLRIGFIKFLAVSKLITGSLPEVQDPNDIDGFEKYSGAELEALANPVAEFHPETYFILKTVYGVKI